MVKWAEEEVVSFLKKKKSFLKSGW